MQIRADATEAAEYRANGWWCDETMGTLVRRWATERPDAVAFVSGPTRFTWAEYDAAADGIARALMAGDPAEGERVAVLMPDGPGVHAAFVGVERAGLVVVGIGHRAGDREIAHLLTLTGARTLVTVAEHRSRSAAALVADLGGLGAAIDRLVLVDVDGAVLDAGVPEGASRGRGRAPLRRPGPRRPVPPELHLGHHRPAQVRHAHPEPVVLLPPAGRGWPATSATTRSSSAPSPRRSASGSGPATSPRASSAAPRW